MSHVQRPPTFLSESGYHKLTFFEPIREVFLIGKSALLKIVFVFYFSNVTRQKKPTFFLSQELKPKKQLSFYFIKLLLSFGIMYFIFIFTSRFSKKHTPECSKNFRTFTQISHQKPIFNINTWLPPVDRETFQRSTTTSRQQPVIKKC